MGIRPNLRHADGSVPRTDRIMFHHGVWLNLAGKDATSGGPERFFAAGEEKTNLSLPKGYGYAYKASDPWLLNYMIHNLVARTDDVYITYDIDFVPATSPAAASIKPARPVWMDVENGKLYPVFDVFRGAGSKGRFTYPTQNPSAYAGRPNRPNRWRVDRDSVLIGTAGHLHAGGLWNDLYVTRKGRRAHLFRSRAKYFEPLGPVSWDLAMTVTPKNYRAGLKKGDVLSTTVTYESKRASWYESMGIMVSWLADAGPRVDPFRHKVDVKGKTTHGHLAENNVHGGKNDRRRPSRRRGVGRVLVEDRDQQLRLPAREVRRRPHAGGPPGPVHHLHQHRRGAGDLPLGDLVPAALQPVHGHRLPDRQRPGRVRLRPAGLRRAAHPKPQHLVHAQAAQGGHLRLLLPHPPVHARGLPGQEVGAATTDVQSMAGPKRSPVRWPRARKEATRSDLACGRDHQHLSRRSGRGDDDVALRPEADTWVDASQPTVSFGTSSQMRVDTSPQSQAYLRFKVAGLAGRPVRRVRLGAPAATARRPSSSWTSTFQGASSGESSSVLAYQRLK